MSPPFRARRLRASSGVAHMQPKVFDDASDLADLLSVGFREFTGTYVDRVLQSDAQVPPQHCRLCGEGHLVDVPAAQYGPFVVFCAEQLVGSMMHMRQMRWIRAHPSENTEYHLDKERRPHQPLVHKPGKVMEVANIVALKLESRAVPVSKLFQRVLDSREGYSGICSLWSSLETELPSRVSSLSIFPVAGKSRSLSTPMLRDAISGLAATAARRRSSIVIPRPPPVVMFNTASVACLITGRNCLKVSGRASGLPRFRIARVKMDDRCPGLRLLQSTRLLCQLG